MTMLDLIVREFISIVQAFEKETDAENNRIIAERDIFKKLLEKNAFATFRRKIKIYKDLNFIIHDSESYTMPYKDKDLGKTVRKVIINYKAYETIKQLYTTNVK